jgi:ketosteroid isomerase-like protein
MTDNARISATTDVADLGYAIERRDAEAILSWYAEDATLTVFDRDHPPAAPARYRGRDEIGAYYRDVCGRNIDHQVRDAIATATGLAYTQHCTYPDGTAVLCSTVAVLRGGKIMQQNAVQVWDT